MKNSMPKGAHWRRFSEFIMPGSNRFFILDRVLKEARLSYSTLEIQGARHFVVTPSLPQEKEPKQAPPVILTAHYDRYEGSPGANDNSAAVFLLIETALRLKKSGERNWRIIFTDKEELKPGESILDQGAYSLAQGLKKANMRNARFFCFDVCGTGDTILISTTLDYLISREGGGEKILASIKKLRDMALNAAGRQGISRVYLVPAPFSDDAGFFQAGLAAQAITVLPYSEFDLLASELRKSSKFAELIINRDKRKNRSIKAIPETWQILNSGSDNQSRLTPEHYHIITGFAEALCTQS